VTKLVSSRDDVLPHVLLDSDKTGLEYQRQLKRGRYKEHTARVLGISDFLGDGEFEIEDLIPAKSIVDVIDRQFRCDQYFADSYIDAKPIVDQIQLWTTSNSIDLPNGWKVDIARSIQNRFEHVTKDISDDLQKSWEKLFANFITD